MLHLKHHISGQKVQWFYVFLLGFFAGILIMNGGRETLLSRTGIFDEYSLYRMKYMTIDKGSFFLYVLQERMGTVLFMVMSATTVLGVAVVYGYAAWLGMSIGMLLSAIAIRYGLKGMFLFGGACLPQQLLYIPACLMLLQWCYDVCCRLYFPARIFEGEYGTKKQIIFRQLWRLIRIIGVVIMGILLESYVNPDIITNLLKVF